MGKGPPTYVLHNEVNNSFLLSARKVLISKAANYMIFNHLDDLSKESTHYVAKLKSNFMRTNFTLSDTRNSARIQEIGYVNYVTMNLN